MSSHAIHSLVAANARRGFFVAADEATGERELEPHLDGSARRVRTVDDGTVRFATVGFGRWTREMAIPAVEESGHRRPDGRWSESR